MPIRVWSAKRFNWTYYPFQCKSDNCQICASYRKRKKDLHIITVQNMIPSSDVFVYKCTSKLASNLIKRIKRKCGKYLRLSSSIATYIISSIQDKWEKVIDIEPIELVSHLFDSGMPIRATSNTISAPETQLYSVTKITSGAPKSIRDKVFSLAHLLVPNIGKLEVDAVLDAVLANEAKILTMCGYQVNYKEPVERRSSKVQMIAGIDYNLNLAKTLVQSHDIITIVQYIKSIERIDKDFLG